MHPRPRLTVAAPALVLATLALLAGCDPDCYDPKHPPASIASAYGRDGCACPPEQRDPVCVQGAAEQFALLCVDGRWLATANETCHP